jgi:hypothetical protein
MWPVVREPRPEPFDTSHDPPPPDPVAQEIAAIHGRNEGLPVFRVGHTVRTVPTLVGMAIGVPAAICASALSAWAAAGAFMVAVMAARRFGRGRQYDYCSEPDCSQTIPADATFCPGCGGTVRGRIARAQDRLAAREDLEDQEEREAAAGPGAA